MPLSEPNCTMNITVLQQISTRNLTVLIKNVFTLKLSQFHPCTSIIASQISLKTINPPQFFSKWLLKLHFQVFF